MLPAASRPQTGAEPPRTPAREETGKANVVTVTATPAVAEAIETAKISSHLHPEGSFELSDHEVPTGREEIWRFTPLKRLRGLHSDADLSGTSVGAEFTAPE